MRMSAEVLALKANCLKKGSAHSDLDYAVSRLLCYCWQACMQRPPSMNSHMQMHQQIEGACPMAELKLCTAVTLKQLRRAIPTHMLCQAPSLQTSEICQAGQTYLAKTDTAGMLQGASSSSRASAMDDDGSDDAELQLLIQQQRIALRHLEALTARRTQQRSDAARDPVPQGGVGAGWGRRGGRSSTPMPESSPEPLPQRGLSSRATTPVPDSPDMQVCHVTLFYHYELLHCHCVAAVNAATIAVAQHALC